MPRTAISLAESAVRDLEEIQVWCAEKGVPEVGERLVAEMFQCTQALAEHPETGRIVLEFDQSFLRELMLPSFRIFYRRDLYCATVVPSVRSTSPTT